MYDFASQHSSVPIIFAFQPLVIRLLLGQSSENRQDGRTVAAVGMS